MSKHKERLDKRLLAIGLFESREAAKKAIMAGEVLVDGVVHTKAGDQVPVTLTKEQVTLKGKPMPFVSRGGFKLDRGLKVFDFPVKGLKFLDIGASTGGFTDCLLQNGAAAVTAIDVGYGQFAWKLRGDERVTCLERMNFRYTEATDLPYIADGSVTDVSFISLLKILPAVRRCEKDGAKNIWLIKPQFEAGKENIGKHGVVRDKAVHRQVLLDTTAGIEAAGFAVLGLNYSPIRGPKGNIEFLVLTQKLPDGERPEHNDAVCGKNAVTALVDAAHDQFKKKAQEEHD